MEWCSSIWSILGHSLASHIHVDGSLQINGCSEDGIACCAILSRKYPPFMSM